MRKRFYIYDWFAIIRKNFSSILQAAGSDIKNKYNVNNNVYYATPKTGLYFQLKCSTPMSLISDVVYKFIGLYDTNVTYIGMTTRQLGVRAEEHLHSKKGFSSTEIH